MDDTQAALRAALQYVRRGWRVFPCWWTDGSHCACGIPTCDNPGKHPLAAAVPSGCLDASADGAAVRAWWFALPRANVAIATGPTSGIWVLDIDREAAGFETLAALEARHGALPDTATVITGGLGEHRYFAHPAEEVPSRAGIAPGLDTRGAGGYVVAPPSRSPHGEPVVSYVVHDDLRPSAPGPRCHAILVQPSSYLGTAQLGATAPERR